MSEQNIHELANEQLGTDLEMEGLEDLQMEEFGQGETEAAPAKLNIASQPRKVQPSTLGAPKAVAKPVQHTGEKRVVLPSKAAPVAKPSKPTVVVKAVAPRQGLGQRRSAPVERPLPKLHDQLNREKFIDLILDYMKEYEYQPTGNKTPVINKGELTTVFTTRKLTEGLIDFFEGFLRSILSDFSIRFAGITFRHRPYEQRSYAYVNSEGNKIMDAAHISITGSATREELKGFKKVSFQFTQDEQGNIIYNDPNAETALLECQEYVQSIKDERRVLMERNKSGKAGLTESTDTPEELTEQTEELE